MISSCKKIIKLSTIVVCSILLHCNSSIAQTEPNDRSINPDESNIPVIINGVEDPVPAPGQSEEALTDSHLVETPPASVEDAALITQAEPAQPDGDIETTLFDIYLGDKFVGAVLADYTDNWLKVSEPQVVIDQLSDLKDGQKLLELVSGRIDKRKEIPKIGIVHYDLNTFQLIIDVAPEFLGVSKLDFQRISPDPNSGFSLQQRVGVTEAGSLQGKSRSAFNHKGIASYGSLYTIADGALIDGDRYELTEATAGGILGSYRIGGGLLQTLGSMFAPSLQFTGINIQTAEELFLDQDLIRGSKFQVFVPSRSTVEFYRDGRLLAVQVLDFGLREINTSAFPQGSYDVDVVITNSFGRVTRERKFFTKAGYLASRGQPIYSLQAGHIRDGLTLLDVPVYQAGVRWRASSIFDLAGSVYGSDKLTIGTAETNGLYRNIRFSAGGSMSSENDAGVSGSVGITVLGTSLSASSAQTIRGGTKPAVLPTPAPGDPFGSIFNLRNRNRELIFQDRTSSSASVSRSFGKVNLRYESDRSSGDGTPTRRSSGPVAEWSIIQNTITTLKLQAARLNTDLGLVVNSSLSYLHKISPHLSIGAEIGHREESKQGDESAILFTINYDDKQSDDPGLKLGFSDEVRSTKPKATESLTSFNNQLDVDYTGPYAEMIGFVRDSRTSNTNNTSVGISAISSFLVSSDASVSMSHPVSNEAVFIADLKSKTSKAEFEIMLDNQVMGKVKAGQRAVIGVTPYRKYAVKIRPVQGSDLVSYDATSKTRTFFPGNVVKRTWNVEKVFIVIGKVVDENGQIIPRQRIKGTNEYTATEDDGTFQAEVGGYEELTIENAQYNCKLDLQIPTQPEYFVDLGEVRCLPNKSS